MRTASSINDDHDGDNVKLPVEEPSIADRTSAVLRRVTVIVRMRSPPAEMWKRSPSQRLARFYCSTTGNGFHARDTDSRAQSSANWITGLVTLRPRARREFWHRLHPRDRLRTLPFDLFSCPIPFFCLISSSALFCLERCYTETPTRHGRTVIGAFAKPPLLLPPRVVPLASISCARERFAGRSRKLGVRVLFSRQPADPRRERCTRFRRSTENSERPRYNGSAERNVRARILCLVAMIPHAEGDAQGWLSGFGGDEQSPPRPVSSLSCTHAKNGSIEIFVSSQKKNVDKQKTKHDRRPK